MKSQDVALEKTKGSIREPQVTSKYAGPKPPQPAAPLWKRSDALVVILTSLLPIVGVLFFDWDAFTIVLLYWFENGFIGLFNALRIAMSKPDYRSYADYVVLNPWLFDPLRSWMAATPRITQKDWDLLLRTPVSRHRLIEDTGFFALLFLGHYSLFMLGHAYLIGRLLKGVSFTGLGKLLATQMSLGFLLAVLVIFVQHAYSFRSECVQGGGRIGQGPIILMYRPYYQIVFIQVALLAGCMLISWLSLPPFVAILLIVFKAGYDLELIRISPQDLFEIFMTALVFSLEGKVPKGKKKTWASRAKEEAENYAKSLIVEDRKTQPRGSRVEIQETADGLRLSIPAQGIGYMSKKLGTYGWLFLSLFFVGIPSLLSYHIFFVPGRALGFGIGMIVLSAPFIVLAFVTHIVWSAIVFGRLRGSIEISKGYLRVKQSGVLFSKSCQWPVGEIAGIGTRDTEVSYNNFGVLELKIRLTDGEEPCFFRGRAKQELNWIATRLRKTMRADIVPS